MPGKNPPIRKMTGKYIDKNKPVPYGNLFFWASNVVNMLEIGNKNI